MDSNKIEKENRDRELKRLGFVRIVAVKTVVLVSSLYDYAKQNSGSLKSAVGTVEGAVTTVVGPVYEKFKGVPDDLLVFVDDKVDEVAKKFDESAPPSAKHVVSKAHIMVQKATQVSQTFVQKAQTGGACAATQYAAAVCMGFFWSVMVRFWFLTNQLPLFRELAHMATPTMAYWSDKYNKLIADLSDKGYACFNLLPRVPINDLAKEYKKIQAEKGPACVAEKESHTD